MCEGGFLTGSRIFTTICSCHLSKLHTKFSSFLNMQDMLEFQKEKQARLNCMPVEVVLRAHQVQPLAADDGRVVPDEQANSRSNSLVVASVRLDTLSARIKVGCWL
jgi:hypothetical protein